MSECKIVKDLRALLNEILDHAIANRGTDDAFFCCYTYGHDKMPAWVAKAENACKEPSDE